MLLFYILQNITSTKVAYFLKGSEIMHTSFQKPILSGTSVAALILQVHAFSLLLSIAEN